MTPGGWAYPIRDCDWRALLDEYRDAPTQRELTPLMAVIGSVIQADLQDQLVAGRSLWDLVISTAPADEPPLDVIIVRSVVSMNPPRTGQVRLEHLATSGLREEVSRPVAEVLPLFWRFVQEKWGLTPR